MATLQANCKHGRRTQQPAGRSGYTQSAEKVGTINTVGHGFLRQRFSPVIMNRELYQHKTSKAREFYSSLAHLAKLYGFVVEEENKTLPYPLNILQSLQQARQAVHQVNDCLKVIIAADETHKACIATVRAFDTRRILYYIPVEPLVLLLKKRRQRKTARLILSLYAYLYKVVRVDYYREECTFMYNHYDYFDRLEEEGSDDDEENAPMKSYYNMVAHFGDRIEKQLAHPYHLQQLENRVKNYPPAGEDEKELHQVAIKLLELYRQYPTRSIYEQMDVVEELDDDSIIMSPDKYLSFYWSYECGGYDDINQAANYEFQETTHIIEPVAMQSFSTAQDTEFHDFDFESRLFPLLDDLIYTVEKLTP